ncbi:hypothetical protein AOQ84DRAFT_433927 [Glonium stellatum]|uniref:NACHT domain-containing protein n=1 Tax=Glonium stellatum TaxID=574774 RepID=A0A8E2ERB6_9PEZI|nr:hypothetical protein AOQ84DRAFT_433927 [Glonium stellatum]
MAQYARQPKFIQKCLNTSESITPNDVLQSVEQVERDSSNKTSTRIIRKVLEPVITVMVDYSGILDTLCQADPMPSAVVWGGLKAVVECSKRYIDLYSQIKSQLQALTERLSRLTKYEKLFGHSTEMQDVLRASYVNILRFWSKVVEECDRSVPVVMMRSVTSISTKRLDEILENLADDANNIARLVPIIQEEMHRDEIEETSKERRKASLARHELSKWIREQRKEKLELAEERRRNENNVRQSQIHEWLRRGSTLNESNFRHQTRGISALKGPGERTCGWLLKDGTFQEWINENSSTLWLNAPPGTGKSVLCASVVRHIKETRPLSGIAYQYYRFDEQCSSMQAFRNIAEQLFEQFHDQLQDIPDQLHTFVRKNNGDPENIKKFIEFIVSELPAYILIDGLDEGTEWPEVYEVVQFFEELACMTLPAVRLWCSSQDRRWIRQSLEHFKVIQVDEHRNSSDIEEYLKSSLPRIRSLDIDVGTKILILYDLKRQTRGNFLWASLMVEAISAAASLEDIQELIQKGLPKDYEVYYDRKLRSIKAEDRTLASKILSCIVYAKRPLYLQELCEAVGVCSTEYGKNMNNRKTLFKEKVLELCAPLVEVREEKQNKHRNVCSLTHSSVRNYLVKKRDILQDDGLSGNFSITSAEIADVCLKYLSQPRYRRLLIKKDDTFYTNIGDSEPGEDIHSHQLLGYAAKYWDKHLDEVAGTPDRCDKVQQFVISRQFLTCLQVQSLLVEGQFNFWFKMTHEWAGPQLRRVFPRWFVMNCELGRSLSQQYYTFVGEWGYFLGEHASSEGSCPGELDHCLWNSLGPEHFLHKNKSRYKSFLFAEKNNPEGVDTSRYFNRIDEQGNEVQVIELQKSEGDESQWNVQCQRWSLNGHRPKLKHTQSLQASKKSWNLYDAPLRTPVINRPPPVCCTPDFKYLHVSSQIFSLSETGDYVLLGGLEDVSYLEELASNGRYFAVATRQKVTHRDLYSTGLDDFIMQNFEDFFSNTVDDVNSSSATPSSEKRSDGASSIADSLSSANSSKTSLSIESIEDTAQDRLPEELDEESLQLDSDTELSSIETNSARESWSEGSTEYHSDETDDEDQWNDWGSGASDIVAKDTPDLSDSDSEVSLNIEVASSFGSKANSEANHSDLSTRSVDTQPGEEDESDEDGDKYAETSSLESNYSQSADSEASSDEENEDGARLEALLSNQRATCGRHGCPQVKLQVYDTSTGSAVPVFQFCYLFTTILIDSPPVFHPSTSLLVWPLGGGEILFADYSKKTYFTRTLRCSAPRSCHIFIRAHFSPCGGYLHLVALEARQDESPIEGGPKPPLRLTLQVSTHRLSLHKTARSPPRLVFRTAIPLGTTTFIYASRLPYSLTWTPKAVYLTKSSLTLDVIKVPLFRSDAADAAEPVLAEVSRGPVFLPRSTELFIRPVYYFPPVPGVKAERRDQATVILGAQAPMPMPTPPPGTKGMFARKHESAPPMGFFVQEQAQMGGWRKLESGEGGEGGKERAPRGGKLHAKFEKFDRVEDCDIVPYFF